MLKYVNNVRSYSSLLGLEFSIIALEL